jgi:3-oxoacyl-[acyl-carrier-protein] synthase II
LTAERRVVVTGIGVISPLGLDVPSMWKALIQGQSGMANITQFDTAKFDTKFAAEVKGFDAAQYMDRKDARRMDRFAQFAVAASMQAVEQAKLKINADNGDEIGVVIGSGIGGLITLSNQMAVLLEKGPDRVSPFLTPMMVTDMASAQVSIVHKAKGPNFCTTSSCASGADAIGNALEIIRRGDAKAMITGGSEAGITPISVAAFNAARALSVRNDQPQKACRPFDAERDGFVLGEGSAVIILEELEFAINRGAPILAEIQSYGDAGDAFHMTQPADGGEGAARAMRMALRKAKLQPTDIDYINAHGTGTRLNDDLETQAIKTVFGENAYRVPISSTKSMMGHLLGAAGAIEAAISILTILEGVIPPTINLNNPDKDCDLDYVPLVARKAKVRTAISNCLGFGGHNAVLLFREYQ